MCVLKKDSGVPLRLQHPVPVERIVRLQGAFEILKQHKEKNLCCTNQDEKQINAE